MRWASLIGVATCLILVARWSGEAARALLIGWVQFLIRVVPQISVDWSIVAAAVFVFAFFTLGVHWFGRAALRVRGPERRWKAGWSLAVSATVVVAFIAGICMIGTTHQAGWLMTSNEPAIVERQKVRYYTNSSRDQLRVLAMGLKNAGDQGEFYRRNAEEDVRHSWATYAIIDGGYYSPFSKDGHGIDFEVSWNDPKNSPHFRGAVPLLINPELPAAPIRDADGYGLAHYALNSRAMANGVVRPFKEFTRGLDATLLIGEVNANFRPWGDPANVRDPARGINRSPYGFGGPAGTNGALFGMADGSVRFISERVNPAVLRVLATPEGRETGDVRVLGER